MSAQAAVRLTPRRGKAAPPPAPPRHFLDVSALDHATLRRILEFGAGFKSGAGPLAARPLAGRTLALIFEKPSTRTRVSFEVAMKRLGGDVVVLSAKEMQLGRGETVADTARVLSRYVDAIMLRTDSVSKLNELAGAATVPVINGLTDQSHPCQIMADVMTYEEHRGPVKDRLFAYPGLLAGKADDAFVIASVSGVVANSGSNTFNTYALTTPVTFNPGDSFFAGAIINYTDSSNTIRVGSLDHDGTDSIPFFLPNNHSWIAGSANGIAVDPNNLALAQLPVDTVRNEIFGGNGDGTWMIRLNATSPTGPATGACCVEFTLPDGTIANGCVDGYTQNQCLDPAMPNNTFQGVGTTCTSHPCQATGACCIPGGCVDNVTQADCIDPAIFGGTYQGDNTNCLTHPCSNTGACCIAFVDPNGNVTYTCQDNMTAPSCFATDPNSIYQGDGTTCATHPCPSIGIGACCSPFVPGGCIDGVTFNDCIDPAILAGVYQGDGTTCATHPCPFFGACCFSCIGGVQQPCLELAPADCDALDGVFTAIGQLCATTNCPDYCPGDINRDGMTDLNDFIVLAGNFGFCGVGRAQGDLNCDTCVDLNDFIILAGDFGCIRP